MFSRIVSYFSALILVLNINAPLIGYALLGWGVAYSPLGYSQTVTEDTPLLDELKTKYDLDNPERNHQDGGLSETITDNMNPSSVNLSDRILRGLNEGNNANTVYDFSEEINERGTSDIRSEERGIALGLGLSHGAPAIDQDTGEIDATYAREGTRKFTRDDDGNLVMEVVEEEDITYVEGMKQNDLTSNEINNDDHVFETPEGYGESSAIRANVRNSHVRYRSGEESANATGRAYQAITSSIDRGMNASVGSDAFLNPSRQTFNDVNANRGEFFQSCQSTTVTNNTSIDFPTYEEFTCDTTNTDNPFFCEVEREYRVPMAAQGNGVTSCGVGCYEVNFGQEGDNYRNASTPQNCEEFSESRLITFNLTDGLELEKVEVDAYVDDHLEFTIDGQLALSMVRGTISYNQLMPGEDFAQCEAGRGRGNGRWNISGDKTFGFKRLIQSNTVKTYELGINHLVGDKGEILGSLRFYFKDTTGKGFGESFTQFPEGCLDRTGAIGQSTGASGGTGGATSTDHCIANGTLQCTIGEYSETGPYGPGCYDSEGNHFTQYQACEPRPVGGSGGSVTPGYAAGSIDEGAFCRFDGWTVLEEGDRGFPQYYLNTMTPMFEGDDGNVTWKANLDGYRCDPLEGGEYCYIDVESQEEVCLSWEDFKDQPDQCAVYEEDESCSEIKRECMQTGWYEGGIGYKDEDGDPVEDGNWCFNETVTYECETNNSVPYTSTSERSTCDAALPCAGGDCSLGETEKNEKFVEAAVRANVIQNVDSDYACEDPSDPTTCRIFDGEYEYCSWEVSGLGMDCCESPGGINILAYVTAASGLMKANKLAADGVFGDFAKQGADKVIEFGEEAFGYVDKAVSSVYNTVMGEAAKNTAETVSESFIGSALNAAQQKVFKLVYNALPEELAKALITETTTGEGASKVSEYALNKTLGSVLNFIGTAYTAYSLVKIGLQLLTMCDENESDMGVKLAQRQCFKVGGTYCSSEVLGLCYQKRQDHCCYSSILARIIMDQAYDQLNIDPLEMSPIQCRGLTQSEFAQLDFDQIDLSEWVGLLVESGEIKSEANEQILTGGGELVETECETWEEEDPTTGEIIVQERCFKKLEGGRMLNSENRVVVSERTVQRVDGAAEYAEDAEDAAKALANDLDCSLVPRPPICLFGIDPRKTGVDGN